MCSVNLPVQSMMYPQRCFRHVRRLTYRGEWPWMWQALLVFVPIYPRHGWTTGTTYKTVKGRMRTHYTYSKKGLWHFDGPGLASAVVHKYYLYFFHIFGTTEITFSSSFCSAIARAVRRRLPTAAARVQSQVRSYWICGGQNGLGLGFLQVLQFTLSILIPSIAPHSSILWRLEQ
jgi:hypothetical protein